MSYPRTWIEELCRLLTSRILSVSEEAARSASGIQELTRCLSQDIKANGHWFRTYKDWAKCRLETRLADIQSRRSVPSSKVLWTFPHVHRLFLLPKYVSRWQIEFSVREAEIPQPAHGSKTRMFDTSVPGQRLSWLLNFERQPVHPRSYSVKWRNGSSEKFLVLYSKIKVFHGSFGFRLSKWILNHQPCNENIYLLLCITKLICLI